MSYLPRRQDGPSLQCITERHAECFQPRCICGCHLSPADRAALQQRVAALGLTVPTRYREGDLTSVPCEVCGRLTFAGSICCTPRELRS